MVFGGSCGAGNLLRKERRPKGAWADEVECSEQAHMKIIILGTPVDCQNRGVQALGASLVGLCLRASPKAEVRLFLGNRDSKPTRFNIGGVWREVQLVNFRMSPRSAWRDHFATVISGALLHRILPIKAVRSWLESKVPCIGALASADLVGDIRGGDSFSDIYGMQRFIFGFLEAWTVILVKGRIVQFPQTYGPFKSGLARRMTAYLLKRSSVVVARDQESQRVAQELAGAAVKVQLSPDVAFSLDPRPPALIQLSGAVDGKTRSGGLELLRAQGGTLVGFNVNGLMYHGGYTRKNMFGLKLDYRSYLLETLKKLTQQPNCTVVLIPHTFARSGSVESDPDASRAVLKELPAEASSRCLLLEGDYDCQEVKAVIGQCDFFIGSRMHACIAALSQGIPTVGVAYSRKFAGVFKSVEVGHWVIDGESVDSEEAVRQTMSIFAARERDRLALKEKVAAARGKLHEVFGAITSFGRSGGRA